MKLTPLPFTVWAITQLGRPGSKGTRRGLRQSGSTSWPSISRTAQPKARHFVGQAAPDRARPSTAPEALDLVVVDDRDEVVEPVMRANSAASHVEPSSHSPSLSSGEDAVRAAVSLRRPTPCRRRSTARGPRRRWRPRRPAHSVCVTWPAQARAILIEARRATPAGRSRSRPGPRRGRRRRGPCSG